MVPSSANGCIIGETAPQGFLNGRMPCAVFTPGGGETDPDQAEGSLEALTWAQQLAHHLMRAVHHLREPAPGDQA